MKDLDHRGHLQRQAGQLVALSRPELVQVKGQAWSTHSSAAQNFRTAFEVVDDLRYEDYERLEVSGLGRARQSSRDWIKLTPWCP
jgi:hypothetical protein